MALILAGERLGDSLAVEGGAGRLRSFARTVGNRRHARHRQATFSEYNSPTYTALDLWFLALAAEYTREPAVKRLARFLEERLWIETALFYHAPSQQFSGPHCRAYLDDSLGGWSALHCTLAVACNAPILLEPQRSLGTNHPSAILENALVAITPFHVPDEARRLAFGKPLPCELRLTTYGESYHENHATRGLRTAFIRVAGASSRVTRRRSLPSARHRGRTSTPATATPTWRGGGGGRRSDPSRTFGPCSAAAFSTTRSSVNPTACT